MKKLGFILLALGLYPALFAQDLRDIIYQNTPVQMGTPRFTATAGAFTALGNDFAGIHLNPAGVAVFRHSEFNVSLGFANSDVEAMYYKTGELSNNTRFGLMNLGYVGVINTDDPNKLINFSITYNRNNEFSKSSSVFGENPESSIIENWMNNAQGIPVEDLISSGRLYEALAWEAFLIESTQNDEYYTEAEFATTEQYWTENIKGHFDELSFSLGVNNDDKLYTGTSISIPFYRYNNTFEYNESGILGDSISGLEWFDTFENRGVGVNIKVGAVYRPTQNFRLGASIFSPTFMWITQEFETSITSYFRHSPSFKVAYVEDEPYSYSTRTAPQANLGAAYIFEKNGFLSIDYTFLPTKWARTSTNELDYLNDEVRDFLAIQHQIKLGGELRLNQVFLRGGYSWLSPAFNLENQNDAQTNIAMGIGYRNNAFTFDVSFNIISSTENFYPYNNAPIEPARENIVRKPLLLSASFRL